MNNGFITIHRKITEWEWYKDLPTYKTFMHCLHKANWKDGKFQGRVIKRGSFVTSYNNFAYETGLTVRQVRTAINKLKLTSELTSETTNKFTIITVTNYCLYQEERQATGQTNDIQMTNKGQTNDNNRTKKQVKTKKQIKNNIEDFEKMIFAYSVNEELQKELLAFLDMRKSIKKPLTLRAFELQLNRLSSFNYNDMQKIKCVQNSVMSSWQSLYELKDNNLSHKKQTKGFDMEEQARIAREVMFELEGKTYE